jgi:hypothetical protein
VAGAWVLAVGPDGSLTGTVAGPAGTFRIEGLVPGSYRIAVTDPTAVHAPEWWHDATDYAAATPLTVTAGVTTTISPDLG